MNRGLAGVLVLLLAATLAGCFGSDAAPEPTPTPSPRPSPPSGSLPADADLAQTGRWLAPFDGQVPAVNMILLDNGRVLYYSGVEANESDGEAGIVFFNTYPTNGQSRVVDLSGASPMVLVPGSPDGAADDLFCSGTTVLPDGRVLAIGSSEWHAQPNLQPFLSGGTDARIYDPATNNWTRGADMLFGRWYPTAITLPDGHALALSGIGSLTNPTEQWPQSEVYDPAADTWTNLGADQLLPLYPRVTVVPGGPLKEHLFYNTVGTLWGPFGEHPLQSQWSFQKDLDLSHVEAGWTDDDMSVYGARQHGSSVMLLLEPETGYSPKFVTFGGTLYQSVVATPFTELADLSTDPPTNTAGPPMNSPRWHHNGVLLPTGEVAAIGGGLYDNVIAHGQPNIAVLPAEIYDPAANTWTTVASMTVERMYHSTAVLLPDGRILAGGHVPLPNPFKAGRDTYNPQIQETRLEIFEPPYLFRGDRPTLTDVDEEIHYGAPFAASVAGAVDHFVLMRPGSTTHAWDSEQRGIMLEHVQQADGSYSVSAPPDAYVAQPGHYMLFAIGPGNGGPVPSVAQFVDLS
ncbi:MAG: hypothetical protein QOC71_514 [Thermoplasmata archaeon]|nr:hypothetical protein [Thermoplasmata archaeon]